MEVMTKGKCRVGTVTEIAAATWLLISTHEHRRHLN